ncbi:hypothetical protein [Nocardioides sp. L-11A]|uniref:hypothetical protein n=1 Tax=Nocardioides sp. L-11A TaxID=3043848 RepID=UPI00249C4CAD|nr:hypothetical protein QJ852_23990 [Nocardioides sp. L-11A]
MDLSRILGTGAAALLLATTLTGCGGSPGDASTEDFCAVWAGGSGNSVDAAHDRAAALDEVGTPDDIDGDARSGFEVFVEQLGEVDEAQLRELDQVAAEAASLAEVYGIDEDDAADVLAFFSYANRACASSTDRAGSPPADSSPAGPSPDDSDGAAEEALTTFAESYLAALTKPDSAAADQLACDGTSTLHDVVSAVEGGDWELGPVSVAGEDRGFAELRETVGDTALGVQAELRDGAWCAVQ